MHLEPIPDLDFNFRLEFSYYQPMLCVARGVRIIAYTDTQLCATVGFSFSRASSCSLVCFRYTLVRTIEILRRYCLHDQPVQLQVLSDQTQNFASL